MSDEYQAKEERRALISFHLKALLRSIKHLQSKMGSIFKDPPGAGDRKEIQQRVDRILELIKEGEKGNEGQ